MKPSLTRRTFRERPVQRGFVGPNSPVQPAVGDRFLSVVAGKVQISVGHASRIARITHDVDVTMYVLADNTIITAPAGARITWEQA